MTTIRTVLRQAGAAVAITLLLAALPFDRAIAQTADTTEASLLRAREAVWRDWFANGPNLAVTLPADFVSIHAGDSTWTDKAGTMASSRASVAEGRKLVSLRFPRNKIERYGLVAVIHSRYEAILDGPKGKTTLRGNITEVFRWDGKRWLHPSWHMDSDG
jgi:hypothetical protein